ncbi:MAG TPA: MmcB family DNA repair protein [Hyphomicrobiales bacterium]|nr:MmcB family DNA repair protein [Hyphomicrobiales bacterium]
MPTVMTDIVPILDAFAAPPAPEDGRQSPMAAAIARGTMRALREIGFAVVTELPLATGRRADLLAFDRAQAVWIVEIKSSPADFRADHKWQDYRLSCDRLFFAVDAGFPQSLLPPDAGVFVADAYGAVMLRDAPLHPLPAARRRAVTLAAGRAAALRLHALMDPSAAGMLL